MYIPSHTVYWKSHRAQELPMRSGRIFVSKLLLCAKEIISP